MSPSSSLDSGITEQDNRGMAMDSSKQQESLGDMRTITLKRAFAFLLPVSVLCVFAPFFSHLTSMAIDVYFYFNVDRTTLFFFCNILLLFLARDSGFLDFFAPANAIYNESYCYIKAVPDRPTATPERVVGTKHASVSPEEEEVDVVESRSRNLEFESTKCSELITSTVIPVESASDELLEEAVTSRFDSELDGDYEKDEEMDSSEDGDDEHEELEEFNRRCEEFIARMKSRKND